MLTVLFSQPFFEGAQIASNVPYYLPVAIGNHTYLLDLKKYQRQTIQPIRPPQDNSPEPGERSLNQEGLWKRSQSSFHLGAGQEYFDDPDSLRQRFYTSKGIDPWTKKVLKLLNTTEQKRSSANTNLKVLQVGTRLYISDGNEVYFTNDPTPASPSWTSATIHVAEGAVPVQSIATDGAKVWAALGANGIHETNAGAGTSTHLAAGTYALVGYGNGRLIAANANVLYEISRAGVVTTIWTHPNPNFTWGVIAGSPNAIYVGGTCVDRSDIYALSALDATGALAAPVFVGSLPDGELLYSIEQYAGILILGTSVGLRLAEIGSNNSLAYHQAIPVTNGVRSTESQGEFVWFSWTNYDGTSTGLGRANLKFLTEQFEPAYASDLMATTQGTTLSVATVGTRRYFAVSGIGFYGETTTPVASGVVDLGWIYYETFEKKVITSFDLRHKPLPAGASITVEVETEEGSTSILGESSTEGTLSPSSMFGAAINESEAIRVRLTLEKGTVSGPELRRWTLYCRIAPLLSDEILAPLIVHDMVKNDLGEGQDIFYAPKEEYEYLKGLAQSKAIQIYQEGASAYTVQLTGVQVMPEDWNVDRSFFNGTLLVRMVTLNLS